MKSAKKYMDLLVKSYMIPDRLPLIAVSTYLAGYLFGENGMAVYGFFLPLYFLFTIVGFAINSGSLTLAMRSISRSDSESARQHSSVALFLSIVTGLILAILTEIFLESIIRILGVPNELHDLALEYGKIFPILGFLLVTSNYVMQFMKMVGLQSQFRMIYKVILVFNGIAIFIFAKYLGFGMESISIGMTIAAIIFIVYGSLQLRKYFHASLFTKIDFSRIDLTKIFVVRSALTLSKIGLLIQTAVYNHFLMLTFGVGGVAIYAGMHMAIQLCRTGSDMSLQPVSPVLTIELGDKNLQASLLLLKTALKRGVVMFALPFMIIIFIVTDHEAYKFYASSLIPASITAVMLTAYLTTRHEIFANLIAILRALILPAAFLYWAFHNDPNLVWWSFPFAEFGTLIFTALGMKFIQKSQNLATPLLIDPKNFPKSNFFVVDRSEGISEDQKSKIDPKFLPIIEEWIKISSEHSDSKKNNFTAIQISSDQIVMRSNGKRFDYRNVIPSTSISNFDWNFKFALGLNNLYVKGVS